MFELIFNYFGIFNTFRCIGYSKYYETCEHRYITTCIKHLFNADHSNVVILLRVYAAPNSSVCFLLTITKKQKKKQTLWMGFNCLKATATSSRQFTFYHSVPRTFWYSFYRPPKHERLSQPWSHPVVLNTGPLDWQSSALTTRSLLHKCKIVAGTKSRNPPQSRFSFKVNKYMYYQRQLQRFILSDTLRPICGL